MPHILSQNHISTRKQVISMYGRNRVHKHSPEGALPHCPLYTPCFMKFCTEKVLKRLRQSARFQNQVPEPILYIKISQKTFTLL